MAPREPDEDGLEEELIDDPQMNLGDQWGMKRMLDEKAIVRSQPLPLLCVQASVRGRAAELRALPARQCWQQEPQPQGKKKAMGARQRRRRTRWPLPSRVIQLWRCAWRLNYGATPCGSSTTQSFTRLR